MSLLEGLKSKRGMLKPVDTLVTQADGRKYLQRPNRALVELEEKSFGFVVDEKPDKVPALIVDCLYLGSQDCCDFEVLTTHKINYVLSVGIEAPVKYPNVLYKFVQFLDLPNSSLSTILLDCLEFIEHAIHTKCNILVHCNAGVSRSAAIVIGYLITNCNMTYDDAYSIVKKARVCIQPNSGFQLQLRQLKKS